MKNVFKRVSTGEFIDNNLAENWNLLKKNKDLIDDTAGLPLS